MRAPARMRDKGKRLDRARLHTGNRVKTGARLILCIRSRNGREGNAIHDRHAVNVQHRDEIYRRFGM